LPLIFTVDFQQRCDFSDRIEDITMLGKWRIGLMTIALAAPFGAHAQTERAQIQATNVHDLSYSAGMRMTGLPDLLRSPVGAAQSLPAAAAAQSDSMVAVVREPSTIRAVNTYQGRVFKASTATGSASSGVVPTPVAPTSTTPQAMAAPEMNSGLAAAALTLLFGGVAILRSRRTRFNAR
jgi:hypothetical protein